MTGTDGELETKNLARYRDPDVVEAYRRKTELTAVERELVDTYVPLGSRLLDIGVGAGRTTGELASRCDYTGIDWSPEMVARTREAFPNVSIAVGDARALDFPDESFDVVFFSFNGIDYLELPGRHRAYLEAHRVLRHGGVFIFSSHNPRFITLAPISSDARVLAGWLRRLPAASLSAIGSHRFRRGHGLIHDTDSAYGSLPIYAASPKRVGLELADTGFTPEAVRVSSPGPTACVPWYYYVGRR